MSTSSRDAAHQRERVVEAMEQADREVYKGMTSYGGANPDRWLDPFLAALAERGLTIAESPQRERWSFAAPSWWRTT